MIFLRTEEEFKILYEAGQILKGILDRIVSCVEPGISTFDLEQIAEERMKAGGVAPAFKGYRGYPNILCTSINDEVVHGIPSKSRNLLVGDIISIDCGIKHRDFFADMAMTIPVGEIDGATKELRDCTRNSLQQGIRSAVPGNHIGDISYAVQKYVESNGFSVVRDYVGHGIGQQLHEEPEIPNFGFPGQGEEIKRGLVICIEPMVNAGTYEVKTMGDNWTVKTVDGNLSAHFEHMIGITDDVPVIFTA